MKYKAKAFENSSDIDIVKQKKRSLRNGIRDTGYWKIRKEQQGSGLDFKEEFIMVVQHNMTA